MGWSHDFDFLSISYNGHCDDTTTRDGIRQTQTETIDTQYEG